MYRRTYLRSASGLAAAATVAGCSMGSGGSLATHVSDQPGDISDFQSCIVTIPAIYVKPTDGERERIDIEDAQADLVDLQGENTELIDESSLETGTYQFLQLEVSNVEATLQDGSDTTVNTPGEAPLKFEKSFEIRSGETTTFIADFTPVKQGRRNVYVLQPVADNVEVIYESATATATP